MGKLGRRALVLLVAALAMLAIASCGGDDDDDGGGGGGGGGGGKGGDLNITGTSYPDFLDPGLSYTVDGWEALHLAYTGLLTYATGDGTGGPDGAEVVPGLAEDMPKISEDALTYEFKLRDGLKYSDGSPVKASDFKHSIERLLEQDSQGAGLGYTTIKGGAEYLESKKGGVPGIVTDDAKRTIKITLSEPRGAFLYELAIPFASVVPGNTPAKNMTKTPPPGTGCYMFKNVEINRSYELVRNPNFSPSLKGTDVDQCNPDSINLTVDPQTSSQVTKIIRGDSDFMIDNPPPDRVAELKSRYSDRYEQFPTNSTFYFFMNIEAPPFDDLKVRQAVNYAIDVNAINRAQGGVLEPAHTTLPPGVPGYDKSQSDLYPFDLDKAKQLIEESGHEGDDVTVWSNPEPESQRTMEYYADTLNKIGLNAKLKNVPAEEYFVTIGTRKIKAQTGWANWFQDYPHPADFIDILLNPDNVVATGNNNYTYNANDKELAQEINDLNKEPELTDDVKKRWGEIDREIQEKAYWGIYGNRKQSTLFSERMDFDNCKGEHAVYTHHWGMFCTKQ
jgi:peptide/nickel transport system substrate-binding protein